jgi:DNA-binding LacI/PurR family transcriptional regulator
MIRLRDIAAQAGCSIMTVSKALRDAPDISAQTTARVKALAQQLGYLPDTTARGLRSRRTQLFGLIISTVANPVFARTVTALEERCHEQGCDLILAHTLNSPEREETCIRRMLSRRVDGLFIFPVSRLESTANAYQELARHDAPVVILGHSAPFCSQFASVETDDMNGSYQVTKYLIDLGHKKIAFFAGPTTSPPARERLNGYRRALREAGLQANDKMVFAAGSTVQEGEQAALQMIGEKGDATAIQTASDLTAVGAMRIFHANKTRIPHDLSIAGYGNILLAEHCLVPLTTVRQPKMRLGVAAMDMMTKLLNGERPGNVRLAAQLVVRDSTAAPP